MEDRAHMIEIHMLLLNLELQRKRLDLHCAALTDQDASTAATAALDQAIGLLTAAADQAHASAR